MPTYRVSTSAEVANGAREETFDVEGDYLTTGEKGGLYVMRRRDDMEAAGDSRWRKRHGPVDATVAYVPRDALIYVRELSEGDSEVERLRAHVDDANEVLATVVPAPLPDETADDFLRRAAAWWRARHTERAIYVADRLDGVADQLDGARHDAERAAYVADGPEGDEIR
jgi:hypothetical protein